MAHKEHHLGLRGRRNVDLRMVNREGLDAVVLGKEGLELRNFCLAHVSSVGLLHFGPRRRRLLVLVLVLLLLLLVVGGFRRRRARCVGADGHASVICMVWEDVCVMGVVCMHECVAGNDEGRKPTKTELPQASNVVPVVVVFSARAAAAPLFRAPHFLCPWPGIFCLCRTSARPGQLECHA